MSEVRVPFLARPSEMCFAPSAPRRLRSRLKARVESRCQRLLTVGFGRAAAYLTLVSVLLTLRPSERCFAPSAPMEL